MPTWVSSSTWAGWVADCGVYTGPLPLVAPPAGVLGTYDEPVEVDYYVTAATAADVVAGTDSPPNNSSFRNWTSPTTTNSGAFASGTVTGTPHLFVIYYASGYAWPTAAPSVDALTLVPPDLAAGGTLGVTPPGSWVDCHGVPAYFSGYGADMGPYIGPWPLLPPGELTGLSGDEIDFYVALPNPADTTDVTIAADGTYDTPIWDSWRYETGSTPPTDFGYAGDSTGPSSPFPVPSTMPAGAHLYVVVLTFTPPTNPPEFYVPASYAAGGAAAFETAMGTWSTDQAAFDNSTSIRGSSGPGLGPSSETASSATDGAIGSIADGLVATLLTDPSPGGPIGGTIIALKSSGPHTQVDVAGQSIVNNFDASGFVDPTGSFAYPNAVLDPLVRDLDYSETPYIAADGSPGSEFAFDDPTAISLTWGTLPFGGDNSVGPPAGFVDMPPDYTDFDVPIRVGWDTGNLDPITGPDQWTYTGTILGDFIGAPGNPFPAPSFTVDMSSVSDPVFHVFWGHTFLYTGVTGATNFAVPDGITYTDAEYVRQASASGEELLPLTVHFPTWRYWIPGAIVPAGLKWHTVAGSWASISGAPMAIFTPGVGPVEYADGPA